jgi:hypothetical protein
MSGTGVPSVSAPIAAGLPAADTLIDQRVIVIGVSSLSPGLTGFLRSSPDMIAAAGYGDAVDTTCGVIEQKGPDGAGVKIPCALLTVPATVPATYGIIDTTGVTGTAVATVDPTSLPYGTYQARLLVSAAGSIGTAGAALQWSLDGGGLYSNPIALGTADSFTIPNSNVKFLFNPSAADLTATNTLINANFVAHNAHVVLTTGTVHTNADTVDQVSAGTYPSATNTATRVARQNAIIAAAKLHAVKGTGGTPATHINVGGDTAYLAALNAIPIATDDESALFAAVAFKAAHNAHINGVAAWHTIGDSTNVIAAASPSVGTLNVGDVIKVDTVGPAPSATDIFDASTSPPTGALFTLAKSALTFSGIACDFPVDATMAATIKLGLDYMAAADKDVWCINRVRTPAVGETETAWSGAVAADFFSFADFRQIQRVGYGITTDAVTGRTYRRSTFAQTIAEAMRVGRVVWPCSPNDRPLTGTSIATLTGVDVGHDEGKRGTAANLALYSLGNRFACDFRSARSPNPESVYLSMPFTSYGSTDTIKNWPTLRVILAIKRVALAAAFLELGGVIAYDPPDPNVLGSTPTLPDVTRNKLQAGILAALAAQFSGEIQNFNAADIDKGLVRIPSVVTVSGGNLVSIPAGLSVKVFGYVIDIALPISIQE